MPKIYSRARNRLSCSRVILFMGSAIAALVFGAAASAQINNSPAQEAQRASFNVGDTAKVLVQDIKLITGDYRVNDQGFIDFPLIGPVKAQGLTPAQLEATLVRLYSVDYLNNPTISISLISAAPAAVAPETRQSDIEVFTAAAAQDDTPVSIGKVLLGGHVKSPGLYDMEKTQTFTTIINEAGGLLKDADPDEVIVSRPQSDTARQSYIVAYSKILSRSQADPVIYPGDIIFVKPKSAEYTQEQINEMMDSLEIRISQAN